MFSTISNAPLEKNQLSLPTLSEHILMTYYDLYTSTLTYS